jgi:ABC-2 type transport system ATP-binding protein
MALLNVESLTHRYGPKPALDGVGFALEPGIVGLLGPNGAGKSTLLKILATLLKPSAGDVQWRGASVLRDPRALRQVLGYLPQDFGVYPDLSAREFLAYLAALRGLSRSRARQRVPAVLEATGLSEVADRRLATYSGGMRQRVGIAQALLGEPELLIVDEPTVGLDPGERLRFRLSLSELAGDRLVLLSTHIVSDLEASTDRLLLLEHGQLRWDGSVAGLIARAQGHVFEWTIAPGELAATRAAYALSASQASGASIRVRAVAERAPHAHAIGVDATLEDAHLLSAQPWAR